MVTVAFNDSGLTEKLKGLSTQLERPTALAAVVGRKAANVLKSHFRARNKTHKNKLSDRRTNFWRAVADSVQAPVVEGNGARVVISITQTGFAQRLFGGTIRPKRTQFLSIPVSEEAYGRTAATFERETGRQLIFLRVGGTDSNSRSAGILASRMGKGFQTEYQLLKSVTQKADPTALPDQAKMAAALVETAEAFVARMVARQKQRAISAASNAVVDGLTDLGS